MFISFDTRMISEMYENIAMQLSEHIDSLHWKWLTTILYLVNTTTFHFPAYAISCISPLPLNGIVILIS